MLNQNVCIIAISLRAYFINCQFVTAIVSMSTTAYRYLCTWSSSWIGDIGSMAAWGSALIRGDSSAYEPPWCVRCTAGYVVNMMAERCARPMRSTPMSLEFNWRLYSHDLSVVTHRLLDAGELARSNTMDADQISKYIARFRSNHSINLFVPH